MSITLQYYWDNRFEAGEIWGSEATPSAVMAYPYFAADQSKRIFVPGCGYGRNSNFFGEYAFDVTACDISEVAIKQASSRAADAGLLNVSHFVGDYFNLPFTSAQKFDGIYLSNILHMYKQQERDALLRSITSLLDQNGLLIMSCLSIRDEKHYGQGEEVEPNTYSNEGRIAHFFSEDELHDLLSEDYQLIEITGHNQKINLTAADNTSDAQLWFVVARKK